jgi:hypothetical protein
MVSWTFLFHAMFRVHLGTRSLAAEKNLRKGILKTVKYARAFCYLVHEFHATQRAQATANHTR